MIGQLDLEADLSAQRFSEWCPVASELRSAYLHASPSAKISLFHASPTQFLSFHAHLPPSSSISTHFIRDSLNI